MEQPLERKGGSDFAQTDRGKKRVRTWQPATGEWKLSRIGLRYFKENPSEYVVSIPVRFDVIRARDNKEVSFKGYFQ